MNFPVKALSESGLAPPKSQISFSKSAVEKGFLWPTAKSTLASERKKAIILSHVSPKLIGIIKSEAIIFNIALPISCL
jgi:hypothetical protein